jgi:hypothetical protein
VSSGQLDDFRELSQEPVTLAMAVKLQVRADSLWVAAYRLDDNQYPGGRHVWSRKYTRPEGKDHASCVEAALKALGRALAEGSLQVQD